MNTKPELPSTKGEVNRRDIMSAAVGAAALPLALPIAAQLAPPFGHTHAIATKTPYRYPDFFLDVILAPRYFPIFGDD